MIRATVDPMNLVRLSAGFLFVFWSSIGFASEKRPNILFIYTDDQSHRTVSCYEEAYPWVKTPNIDALAERGIRFTEGYVSHPVCSPSRAGLMTGRYQQRHGWELNPAGRDVSAGMSAAERTLADVMKAQGYATGIVGKWHLGYQGSHHPLQRGFDEFFGVLAGGSLEGIELIYLVPHGSLNYLPFALLPSRADGTRRFIEDFTLAYLPTAAALLRPEAGMAGLSSMTMLAL